MTDRAQPSSSNRSTCAPGPSHTGGSGYGIDAQQAVVDNRITELEIKVAYLEDTIKQLDDEVYRQQRQIERLEILCGKLSQDVQAMADRVGPASTEQEIPPHY